MMYRVKVCGQEDTITELKYNVDGSKLFYHMKLLLRVVPTRQLMASKPILSQRIFWITLRSVLL